MALYSKNRQAVVGTYLSPPHQASHEKTSHHSCSSTHCPVLPAYFLETLIKLNIQQGYAMNYVLSTCDSGASYSINTVSIMQDIQNENVL
jgi:hypothetical protein